MVPPSPCGRDRRRHPIRSRRAVKRGVTVVLSTGSPRLGCVVRTRSPSVTAARTLPSSPVLFAKSPWSRAATSSFNSLAMILVGPCPGDHDFPYVPAGVQMAIGFPGIRKQKDLIDHGAQAMLRGDAVHGLVRGAAAKRGSSVRHEAIAEGPPVDGDPVPKAPMRATSLLNAAALSDRAGWAHRWPPRCGRRLASLGRLLRGIGGDPSAVGPHCLIRWT